MYSHTRYNNILSTGAARVSVRNKHTRVSIKNRRVTRAPPVCDYTGPGKCLYTAIAAESLKRFPARIPTPGTRFEPHAGRLIGFHTRSTATCVHAAGHTHNNNTIIT